MLLNRLLGALREYVETDADMSNTEVAGPDVGTITLLSMSEQQLLLELSEWLDHASVPIQRELLATRREDEVEDMHLWSKERMQLLVQLRLEGSPVFWLE